MKPGRLEDRRSIANYSINSCDLLNDGERNAICNASPAYCFLQLFSNRMMPVRVSVRPKRQIVSQKYRQPADEVSTVVFIAATVEISPKNAVKHKRASERLFGAPTLRSDLRSRFPVDRSFVEGN